MIVLDVEQGSPEWERCRLGIPTTSEFSRIVTPARLDYASGATTYLMELLAEWVTGHALEPWVSPWADRGTELEPEARRFLSFELGREVRSTGFVYRDSERMCGCSPDGLIHDDAEPIEGAEIKCPAAKTHIRYLLEPEAMEEKYRLQVQGGLWVTGLASWQLCSYYPGLPPVIRRVEPDPEVQDALGEAMPRFLDELREHRARLLDMGITPRLSDDPTETPEWALPSVDALREAS